MQPSIDERATVLLSGLIGQWDRGAVCLTALAVAADGTAPPAVAATARDVVAAAGLGEVLAGPERLPFSLEQVSGMAASPVLQAAALLGDGYRSWAAQSDAALIAQGRASGSTALLFAGFVLPLFDGLADRLGRPGARMLDVGTGIGALAAGFAQRFPQLHVTGIDVLPRVLDIARRRSPAGQVATRLEFRRQSVEDLADESCYDLAWIPAPFVPEPAFSTGMARIVTALRPGGVLVVGHGAPGGGELAEAITRFKTVIYGGTLLDAPAARGLLIENGLTCVQTAATPPGAPTLTAGQK